ncbi:MAG TPA: hypothetical protein ENK77_03705 [Epsilonproteobacteria bacterium]|nr:hypothetical protein [Campylobacterota bacterium]
MRASRLRIPELSGSNTVQKRDEIKAYFNFVYARYESLFALLADTQAYYTKADRLRHPLIFY